ncbi:MAG: peptidase M15 [Bacteroidales bacterium]|nr:peptidase M15 [Bacteroidales bacterium]
MRNQIIFLLIIFSTLLFSCGSPKKNDLPEGFVYLNEVIPEIDLQMRYYGNDNFVGTQVKGYEKEICICTKEAALAIKEVQEKLAKKGYSLRIFDAYRPQRAVNHFIEWAKNINDTLTKSKYYPEVKKKDLFRLNYIAEKSSHSRGSTLDITLLDENGEALDMGTPFDYFGPKSWPTSNEVTKEQKDNRMILQGMMIKYGFNPYQEEWWHFTLKDETFPDTYFDFTVK